ncbi:MAG: DUF456 domain-containing protein [Verrucomicrobiota bacterium]
MDADFWWTLLFWSISVTLMIVGLIGTIMPFIPGPLVIFVGAVVHFLLLPDHHPGWTAYIVLLVLLLIAFALEYLSASVGAKMFGSTKWGMIGAIVGGMVGIFFSLPGLILGPLIGVFAFEMIFGRKEVKTATRSTWGSLLGGTVGMIAKVVIGVVMVIWFYLCVFLVDLP